MTTIPLIERAGRHAERIAVDDLVRTYTYGELVNAARLVACNLLGDDRDLQEARIAYMLPAGFEYIAAQWGIWQAGGIAVPLSLSATEKELEYTLTDAEVHCIITSENLLSKLAGLGHQLNIPLLAMDCLDTAAAGPLPEIDAQRAAMILYTSGTTSKPKGVVSTHACIQSQIETLIKAWAWNAEDRIPLFLPLHHIHGIINIMSCALWSGGRIETFHRFEIETVMRRVADHAYTVFMAVPTIYAKLIDRLSTLPDDRYDAIIDGFRQMRLM
ncbi:MAG TPA: AMP-binding protein, partial [Pontiella sp.]|nr:AMP-binding protein [Pontiella sp.]